MLNAYRVEINALSRVVLDENHIKLVIEKVKSKLPSSMKSCHKLLRLAVSSLLDRIKSKDYNASFGMLRFVFYAGFEDPLSEARKQGVFRVSKVEFDPSLIKDLLEELSGCENLSSEELQYVRSVIQLLVVAPEIRNFREEITKAVSTRSYFLKTVLSIAEAKYSDLLEFFDERLEKPYVDILFYNNKESFLTAASYLVQVYQEVAPPLRLQDSNDIDESINHDFYLNLFLIAFVVTLYLEVEIKVDVYGYEISVDTIGKKINVDNVDFETAKSYGYTKTDLRVFSQVLNFSQHVTSKSYIDLLEEFWDKDSKNEQSILYELRPQPVERIVLKQILTEYGHEVNIFSHDYLFKEEEIQMFFLMNENYNSDIFKIKIYKNFTCLDLFKLQRFFKYVAFVYKKSYEKLRNNRHENSELIRKRSILPVFDKGDLVEIFQNTTGKSSLECESLLDKLTNENSVTGEIVDLQYKPILTIENRYLIMPTVFAYSSLSRSLAISENVHFSVSGKNDHMIKRVLKALRDKGFKAQSDFHFGKDEVDVTAVHGEHLFLFECKNPYHPVNDFELRNTYAHLEKGFAQIENFKNRFRDRQVLNQFLLKLKIDPKKIKKIYYGVINANRALSGLTRNGIRVFHANELISFISSGEIISAGDRYSCWRANSFDVSDLVAYMEGKVLTGDMEACKEPMPLCLSLGNYSMCFSTFQYNLAELNLLHKTKYRYIGSRSSSL